MLLKTFIRSFRKNTFFSTLNILGLALGMGVFLLIAQYVHFETSYEDFNSNSPNIYRVTRSCTLCRPAYGKLSNLACGTIQSGELVEV